VPKALFQQMNKTVSSLSSSLNCLTTCSALLLLIIRKFCILHCCKMKKWVLKEKKMNTLKNCIIPLSKNYSILILIKLNERLFVYYVCIRLDLKVQRSLFYRDYTYIYLRKRFRLLFTNYVAVLEYVWRYDTCFVYSQLSVWKCESCWIGVYKEGESCLPK